MQELDALTAALRPVFEKHRIRRAIVFGSFARGDVTRRSDVDLLVVQETDKRFIDRYAGLLDDVVGAAGGRAVDLLVYTPAELESLSGRPFVKRILRAGVTIYEPREELA
jgi:predicted nucleotidyltransferase